MSAPHVPIVRSKIKVAEDAAPKAAATVSSVKVEVQSSPSSNPAGDTVAPKVRRHKLKSKNQMTREQRATMRPSLLEEPQAVAGDVSLVPSPTIAQDGTSFRNINEPLITDDNGLFHNMNLVQDFILSNPYTRMQWAMGNPIADPLSLLPQGFSHNNYYFRVANRFQDIGPAWPPKSMTDEYADEVLAAISIGGSGRLPENIWGQARAIARKGDITDRVFPSLRPVVVKHGNRHYLTIPELVARWNASQQEPLADDYYFFLLQCAVAAFSDHVDRCTGTVMTVNNEDDPMHFVLNRPLKVRHSTSLKAKKNIEKSLAVKKQ